MSDDIKKYVAVIEAATGDSPSVTVQKPVSSGVLTESAAPVVEKSITSVEALLNESRGNGFEVLEENDIRAIQNESVSVVIWENGSITRGDVPLDKMTRMTLAEAAELLGL